MKNLTRSRAFLILIFPLTLTSAWADQTTALPQKAATQASTTAPQPGPAPAQSVGIYAVGLAVPVGADFAPIRAYIPCQPPPPNMQTSPLISDTCAALQNQTGAALSKAATKILGGAVSDALTTGGGSGHSSVTPIPLPQDLFAAPLGVPPQTLAHYEDIMPHQHMGKHLAALPFMERRAALIAIDLNQKVSVEYQGRVHDGAAFPATPLSLVKELLTHPLKRTGPLSFDGISKLTYSATYKLYSVDTGQLLRTGTIGPVSMDTPSFHALWHFWPAHSPIFNPHPWTVADLIAQGRIQDPRVKVMTETMKEMAPQVMAATEASLKDWPQVVQAANQLLAGQH